MTADEQLILELQKINKKLDILSNPFKNAGYNFVSGVWRSLGSLFGTIVISAIVIYFLSRLNITQSVTQYIEKLIPRPQVNLTVPSLQLSPGQL